MIPGTLLLLLVVGVALLFLYYRYKTEGFADLNVSPLLFRAKVAPGGYDEGLDLSPGGAMDPNTEKTIASGALPAMTIPEAESHWGEMTSQKCFRTDIGEALKPTRNFLQRTNNYKREHPDDCSAPNHEFVGTFYKPFDGVGRTPACGADYPPSTQCGPALGF